jgi:hypothetical protein
MNEQDWDTSLDLQVMLGVVGGQLGSRQSRLFACGCCRLVWPLLADPAWRQAVQVSEAFAEGRVDSRELATAWRQGWAADSPDSAGSASLYTSSISPSPSTVAHLVQRAAWWKALREVGGSEPPWTTQQRAAGEEARRQLEQQQCNLLREIAGNPFHRLHIDSLWHEVNDGAVQQLATLIDREHDFSYLPILADALEDAGCNDHVLLGHCRRAGGHVLGCWVLDALLGRK